MRDIAALLRFLAQRERMPFAWGRRANDCASYALLAAEAQLHRDPLPDVTWTTARGAARVIRTQGGIEAAADRLFTRIGPALAMRGDIAAIEDARFGVSLLIVEGVTIVGPGEGGNVRLPREAMIAAWSIGG